ncbi:MAG: transposase [Anaerolineae bacterium]|nr:transposase [Anaerolineae bacterium]
MSTSSNEMVLAFDFSLDRLDVALRGAEPDWRWGHRAYPNNWVGYQQLKQDLLEELERASPVQLTAVGESTGPYWWHAFYHLSHDAELASFEPQLALLNPAHLRGYRKALAEQDKTDPNDARLIDHYYRAVGVKHPYQFADRYLRLRTLSRAYARVMHSLGSEKAYLLSVLYLWGSEYQRREVQPFANLFGATSQFIFDEYADLQALADIPLEELSALLTQRSGHTLRHPTTTATKLQQVAENSYPLPAPLAETLYQVLQLTLAHIRLLTDTQQTYRQLLVTELDSLPEAQLARSFKGLGPILVAGCLAEIQDTSRFLSGTKLDQRTHTHRPRTYRDGQAAVAKLAGLWWPKHDSGRVQGCQPHLARERNPYLRLWLVQSAYTLQRYQPDYKRFYWKKYHETLDHPHKRALILTARKATRLIFALLHKGRLASLKEGLLT